MMTMSLLLMLLDLKFFRVQLGAKVITIER